MQLNKIVHQAKMDKNALLDKNKNKVKIKQRKIMSPTGKRKSLSNNRKESRI